MPNQCCLTSSHHLLIFQTLTTCLPSGLIHALCTALLTCLATANYSASHACHFYPVLTFILKCFSKDFGGALKSCETCTGFWSSLTAVPACRLFHQRHQHAALQAGSHHLSHLRRNLLLLFCLLVDYCCVSPLSLLSPQTMSGFRSASQSSIPCRLCVHLSGQTQRKGLSTSVRCSLG